MKITVWDTIFLLLTIIPVSRMFSTIFMKFIVRMGTVNEEKWAGRATMGLGGLLTLGRFMGRGFMSGGRTGSTGPTRPSGGSAVSTGGTRPHPGGGGSGGAPPVGGGSQGGASTAGAPYTPPSGRPGADSGRPGGGQSTGARASRAQAAGPVNVAAGEVPAGYTVRRTASGLYVASRADRGAGTAPTDTGSAGGEGSDSVDPVTGRDSVLDRMMDDHREVSQKAAGVGAVVGGAIGLATGEPLAAGMTAAVVAMSGRAIGSTAHTASRLGGGMYREMKGGRTFTEAAKAVTGEARGQVAVTKLVTATAAAPLGHVVQRQAVRGAGWAAGRFRPERSMADRPDYR